MNKEYIELIKLIENEKTKLKRRLKKTIFFKNKIYEALNKYDDLLLKIYSKYEKDKFN